MAAPPPTDPLSAVQTLSERLYGALDYEAGVTRADSPIDHALEERRGVCQDFAHIMIAACRAWGVPARYVSGFLFIDRTAGDRSDPDATHAWVEAFLPFAGWIGFDPTNNCLAGERHVAVAIGRDYGDVPPTRGVYKGAGADELAVAVDVRQASARQVQTEFARSARVVISGQGRRLAPPPALLEAQLLQQQ
jgi:transglutaminase-like putative cysteine protease